MGRIKYPRCKRCGKITEQVGNTRDGGRIFGCKTPKKCGYKEYIIPSSDSN